MGGRRSFAKPQKLEREWFVLENGCKQCDSKKTSERRGGFMRFECIQLVHEATRTCKMPPLTVEIGT